VPVPRRRERDAQGQTALAVARRRDVSAVRFDDGTVDGQPHAEPLGLARDEGLEHALELRSGQAGAGIGHADLDPPGLRLPRLDAQHTGSVRDVGHGLAGVDEQVEHDLLELDTIPEHPRQVLGQAKLQRDVGLRHVSAQNRRHPGDRRIDVDGLALAWLPADRGAYPLHEPDPPRAGAAIAAPGAWR